MWPTAIYCLPTWAVRFRKRGTFAFSGVVQYSLEMFSKCGWPHNARSAQDVPASHKTYLLRRDSSCAGGFSPSGQSTAES